MIVGDLVNSITPRNTSERRGTPRNTSERPKTPRNAPELTVMQTLDIIILYMLR